MSDHHDHAELTERLATLERERILLITSNQRLHEALVAKSAPLISAQTALMAAKQEVDRLRTRSRSWCSPVPLTPN